MSPWRIQMIGNMPTMMTQMGAATGEYVTVLCDISYVKDQPYYLMDYTLVGLTDYGDTRAHLYLAERAVLDVTGTDWGGNSVCTKGWGPASAPRTPIGVFRDQACGPYNTNRAHVFRIKGGFTTFMATDANGMIYNVNVDGFFGNIWNESYDGTENGIIAHKFMGVTSGGGTASNRTLKVFTTRILSGYGNTLNDFDAVPGLDSVPVTGEQRQLTVEFEKNAASGLEGDIRHGALNLNVKVYGTLSGKAATLCTPMYVPLKAVSSGANPAVAGADYECKRGIIIPAGVYQGGVSKATIISVDTSIIVLGNTMLQNSPREVTFTLDPSLNNNFLKVNTTANLCVYSILDDEARTITLTAPTEIDEGQTANATVSLPSGVVAAADITVNLTRGAASSVATGGDVVFPSSVVIRQNTSSATFTIQALGDKVLEYQETLELQAEADVLGVTQTASASVGVKDRTYDDPANRVITMRPVPGITVGEPYSGGLQFNLPAGVTTTIPIVITLGALHGDPASTASVADYTLDSTNFSISSGNSVTIAFTVVDDNFVEGTEKLYVTGTAADVLARTFDFTPYEVLIQDDDANSLKVTASAANMTEGGPAVTFTVSLPVGTLASTDIPLTVTGGGTSSSADHTALPDATFRIPAGANNASFTLSALTDNLIEGDETLIISGGAGDFSITPFLITIKDATLNDPANGRVQMTVIGSGIKEGTSAGLKVSFVNDVLAGRPIAVTLARNLASAAGDADLALSSGTITIPAGQREVTISGFITGQTDQVLERTESFTLDGAILDIAGLTVSPVTDSIKDATGDDPANKVITISTQPTPMDEGLGYNVTFSLPAGITTEFPINIVTRTGVGSTATDADYSFAAVPQLTSGNASASATIDITADGIMEADETLVIDATSADMPGITFTPATVTLKDKDYIPGMGLTVTADRPSITEGSSTGAVITVSLPEGKYTSYDIPVTISKGAASVAENTEHSALPATVVIRSGTRAISFPQSILANSDNLLEEDESLIIEASSAGLETGSLTLNIKDGGNPKLSLQPQPFSAGTNILEGNSLTVRVSLPAGITPYKPLNVTIGAGSASVAVAGDYTALPATVTINPGENFKDITFAAANDNVVEKTELLQLSGTVTGFAGVTVDNLDLTIEDLTSKDPANLQLQVLIDSTTLHEGNNAIVRVGFVRSVITSSEDITIDLTPDAAFTGDAADYTGLAAQVVLPAGTNQVQHTMHMESDNLAEGTEVLKLNTTVAATYTVTPPNTVTIPESPLELTAAVTTHAAEPATNGAFTIRLPGGLLAGADINVSYVIGGTADASDWQVVPLTAVIPAGSNSVSIPVTVIDDKLMEGDETVTLALQQAEMPRVSGTVSFLVNNTTHTVNLKDDENVAEGRSMMVEKVTDAREPDQPGAFRIRFSDPQLTVLKDVQVTYAVSGTAIPGTDYTPIATSLTIPAGENGVMVNIQPLDDITVEDEETVHIQIQTVTSTMAGITWPLAPEAGVNVPLVDNDSMNLSIMAQPSIVTEGETMQMTLTSPAISLVDVPVYLKVVHDPARTITTSVGTINANGDTLMVRIPAGVREYSFNVSSVNNLTNDDDGFVFLQVLPDRPGAPKPAYFPGLASDINVTVEDNDSLTISFRESAYQVNEGNSPGENSLTFEVMLDRASSRPITLPYKFVDINGVSFMGAATRGVDFDSVMKPIEIQPGELSIIIPVAVFGDSTFERNDTFGIKLLTPGVESGENVPGLAIDSAMGIILNDDPFCPICDTDGDGIQDGKEDNNNNGDPIDDDADGDGIPNYLDDDSDNDGVPDAVEGWITDGRWVNDNSGKIRVHPAVSPNGDGMGNDAMYIENIEKYERNEVVLFNRWGGTVFKMSNYDNKDKNFRGLNNSGKEVTDGSYFYLIQVWDSAGKQEQYVGFIVVKRK
jgi:gliding motility-associated-like protein